MKRKPGEFHHQSMLRGFRCAVIPSTCQSFVGEEVQIFLVKLMEMGFNRKDSVRIEAIEYRYQLKLE